MLQTVKLSCLADRKEALIVAFLLQGGPPQLVFLWPVAITGAMSIYNFLYCRLLKRMTNCWLTLLMGILHLHRYRTKQLNQVLWLTPISACFYVHIITETKQTSCECMCVCHLPSHSVSFIWRKKKSGDTFSGFCLLYQCTPQFKSNPNTLFLHHGYSCSSCSPPPSPFVLVTPLTCSHHCSCRHGRSQQRA